jgi:hypothetical protein
VYSTPLSVTTMEKGDAPRMSVLTS